MLMLGEVHTVLLQNSTSLQPSQAARILALVPGEQVRVSERPIAYAVSPAVLTGVDCPLATFSGAKTRGVGSVVSRACITGGHVLQGSTFVRVDRDDDGRRRPWSHYLARPGVLETLGKADLDDLAAGFVDAPAPPGGLDLGAVSGRVMDSVQRAAPLDRRPPFRMTRTRLRWLVTTADRGQTGSAVRFTVENGTLRTLRIDRVSSDPAAAAALCEDLALHDWLLTTLLTLVERSRIGAGPRADVVRSLGPAIDHLLHLWMPGARTDASLAAMWESLERRPGFTRQWQASVNRVRDQIAFAVAHFGASAAQNARRA